MVGFYTIGRRIRIDVFQLCPESVQGSSGQRLAADTLRVDFCYCNTKERLETAGVYIQRKSSPAVANVEIINFFNSCKPNVDTRATG